MSQCCYECGTTLLSDHLNIYSAAFALSLMQRSGDGRLLISNNGLVVCRAEYERAREYWSDRSGQVDGRVFFALDNEDGFEGAATAHDPNRIVYRFLTLKQAKKALPKTSKQLLDGLEAVTWLRFAELFKKQTA